ncbi:MAG: hypothetical protein ACLQRH_00310 [Acidimicrobiales bacterium]
MLVGIFNVIDGIVTIANPHYFAIYSDGYTHHLIFGDLSAWGWAILIVGIVQFLAALAIFSQQSWGAVVGIIVASLGAIGQLLYLGVDPWWSIIVIAIDILVIYALAMHGFPERA